MDILLYILAVLPGLLICAYIYWLDRNEREHWSPLLICFGFGMLITFPAIWLQQIGTDWGLTEDGNFLQLLGSAFMMVAFSEELLKFLVLMLIPYPRNFFNEPMDGIVYSVMIGMGFATLENIFHGMIYGIEVVVFRDFTAVPAHAVFAVFMGFFVGLAKFEKKYKYHLIATGLITAIVVHGLYDFFILQGYFEWLMLLAIVILIASIFMSRQLIRIHQQYAIANNSLTSEDTVVGNDIMDAVIDDLESEEDPIDNE